MSGLSTSLCWIALSFLGLLVCSDSCQTVEETVLNYFSLCSLCKYQEGKELMQRDGSASTSLSTCLMELHWVWDSFPIGFSARLWDAISLQKCYSSVLLGCLLQCCYSRKNEWDVCTQA